MKHIFSFLIIGLLISPPALKAQTDDGNSPIPPNTQPLEWQDFGEALEAAEVSGRALMVDVYAPWCPWCQRLQKEVYAKDDVRAYLNKNFETVRLDIDDADKVIHFKGYELSASELAAGLGAEGTPTIVFLSSTGDYITRVPGFIEAPDFMHVLHYINTGAFQTESFQDYRKRNP
ncbi:MAG: thioredoxin fold domain-containing protein [Bacteroidota bacterium]